jgi:hypothetical protein
MSVALEGARNIAPYLGSGFRKRPLTGFCVPALGAPRATSASAPPTIGALISVISAEY